MSVLFPLYYPATNEQQVLLQHIALHVLKVINDLISAEYTYLHDCA